MTRNKLLVVNLIANLFTLGINMLIGFFMTPYIVNTVSSEAYGFVSLANNVIGYAAVIVIAINSVAGRFISISVYKEDYVSSNQYFTSVAIANMVFALLLAPIAFFFIYFLENIIQIPENLIASVKLLFCFVFVNFIVSILSTVYTVATFITNKLYINSIINAFSNSMKVLLFFLLFSYLTPNIAIVGFGTLISTLLLLFANIYYTRKLIPNLVIEKKYFSINKILELIASGGWNVVTKISQILSDGLDLLLTNLWISAFVMGQFSIAKTILMLMSTFIYSISNIFAPQLTMLYAKNDLTGFEREIKLNMKITSFFSNIPFSFLVIFGDIFYSLWVPDQDIHMIQLLTIISIQAVLVSGATNVLYNVFVITNKIKITSLFWLGVSFFNVSIVVLLLKNTNLGVYAIAGVSTSVGLIAHLSFLPMYACKCLEIKWNSFHPIIFRYILTTLTIVICFYIIRIFIQMQYNWLWFIFFALSTCILGFGINYLLLFNKEERSWFLSKIMGKLNFNFKGNE